MTPSLSLAVFCWLNPIRVFSLQHVHIRHKGDIWWTEGSFSESLLPSLLIKHKAYDAIHKSISEAQVTYGEVRFTIE